MLNVHDDEHTLPVLLLTFLMIKCVSSTETLNLFLFLLFIVPIVNYSQLLTCVKSTAMPKMIEKAKIACLDFSLQKAKMKLGVSVVIDDPHKLAAIREK